MTQLDAKPSFLSNPYQDNASRYQDTSKLKNNKSIIRLSSKTSKTTPMITLDDASETRSAYSTTTFEKQRNSADLLNSNIR